ncbi:hypothetical protein KCU69_g912, partial [Aureobasidium melanogenum]
MAATWLLDAADGLLLSWKLLFFAYAVANWKSLPGAWTARLAFYYFRELYRFKARPKTKESALDLHGNPVHPIFAVKSTSSYCSLRETDYNFHKSNSTYYADLDAARVPSMTAFYFPGRDKLSHGLDEEYAKEAAEKGKPAPEVGATMFVALGGVYCSFKKEIKPFERYEMRSSVVAWDQKWIYNMTHFIKRGADGNEIIAAAALSKYCVKKGRRTVPPERLLEAWDLVPSGRQPLSEEIKVELGDPMALSLADAYYEDRSCPTLMTSYIDWEQSIAEANINPLHKCRMPFESATQPSRNYDFKHTQIAFLVIRRDVIRMFGPLEAQLSPLLKLANIDETAIDKGSEMIVPVHDFQVSYLLSRPEASDILRVLPQKVPALAQASTRSMAIPGLPGLCVKLSLSIYIGDALRTINHKSAFNAVHYWSSGMLDTRNVVGLRDAPVEIFPEVACGNAMQDHLAVMIRWDAYHESRPSISDDVGYAVTGALAEPAILGQPECVAAAIFNLSSKTERMAFLREYVRLYFRCFLPPLFCNGLLLDAHGQNSLLRYSRATGSLLGFSCRDVSGTSFNKMHFERTTGLEIDPRMGVHDMNIRPLLERAYFIFFVVHLCPLMIALDPEPCKAPTFTSEDLLNGRAGDKEASDIANGIGSAVIVPELHEILLTFDPSNMARRADLALAMFRVAENASRLDVS